MSQNTANAPSNAAEPANGAGRPEPAGDIVIEVAGLHKRHGSLEVVRGVGFSVRRGTMAVLVGPNGSGKTTLLECLLGLRTPDAGTVRLLGLDPRSERGHLFQRVGVQLQSDKFYSRIRAREALELFAAMAPSPASPQQLLEELALADRANVPFSQLSGGERRRLLAAMALVGRPELAILDEPTTGLDPIARTALWRALARRRAEGTTILLSTHDLAEAQQHSDQVLVMAAGRLIACGPAAALVREARLENRLAAVLPGSQALAERITSMPEVTGVRVLDDSTVVYGRGAEFLVHVARLIESQDVGEITIRAAGLEDLYLQFVGPAEGDATAKKGG